MRRVPLLLATCATLTVAAESAAQRPGNPRRLSTTIGLSKGAGALTCPFCTGEGKGGLAGMVGVDVPFRPASTLSLVPVAVFR